MSNPNCWCGSILVMAVAGSNLAISMCYQRILSALLKVTTIWLVSSVGRALAKRSDGPRFKSWTVNEFVAEIKLRE